MITSGFIGIPLLLGSAARRDRSMAIVKVIPVRDSLIAKDAYG